MGNTHLLQASAADTSNGKDTVSGEDQLMGEPKGPHAEDPDATDGKMLPPWQAAPAPAVRQPITLD